MLPRMAARASPRGIAEERRRFAPCREISLELGNCLDDAVMVECAGGGLRAGRRRQPVLVVLQEQAPSVGVAPNEAQHDLPGFVHERLVQQRPREQV